MYIYIKYSKKKGEKKICRMRKKFDSERQTKCEYTACERYGHNNNSSVYKSTSGLARTFTRIQRNICKSTHTQSERGVRVRERERERT